MVVASVDESSEEEKKDGQELILQNLEPPLDFDTTLKEPKQEAIN